MFERNLVEESKHVIQLRLNQFDGFQQAVFIAPQQLSHRARGEETHTQRLHVGRDQIGHKRVPEPLHQRLRTDTNMKSLAGKHMKSLNLS